METKIKVAISYEKVLSEEVNINYPEKTTYYSYVDDGRFFPEGLILFAVICHYPNYFYLLKVTSNKQDFTDFKPSKDCNSKYWINEVGLRRDAFRIFTNSYDNYYKEISEEEFNIQRELLLNKYKEK